MRRERGITGCVGFEGVKGLGSFGVMEKLGWRWRRGELSDRDRDWKKSLGG